MEQADTWKVRNEVASLVAFYRPWLVRRALRLCRDRADAEDLAHEVLVRFFAHFDADLSHDGREAWLATTLRNLFVSSVRHATVERRARLDPVMPGAGDWVAVDLTRPEVLVSQDELAAALARLTAKQREVVTARAAGKRNDEIATAAGIARGAVAKRLHDARARLRHSLVADGSGITRRNSAG